MVYLADIFIWLIGILLVAASAVAVVTKIMSLRKNRTPMIVNGIPAKAITWSATGGTILILLIAYIVMPADTMMINGKVYDDALWLRISDMCVVGCLVLLVIAVLSIAFGIFQNRRTGSKQDIPSMFIRKGKRKK